MKPISHDGFHMPLTACWSLEAGHVGTSRKNGTGVDIRDSRPVGRLLDKLDRLQIPRYLSTSVDLAHQ